MMVSNRLISNEGGMNTGTTLDVSQSGKQQQQQSQPVPIKYDNKIINDNNLGCIATTTALAT